MIQRAHFIGIGGIGMSALARILMQSGVSVSGSDAKSTALTAQLEQEGMIFLDNGIPENSVVIYSSAIPPNHPDFMAAKEQRCTLLHRADLLQKLLEQKQLYAVAGAHGKTTISAMLSWVLTSAALNPSFAIGGLVNALGGNGAYRSSSLFVAEADESDGSFLKLNPHALILTSGDLDHLDYWKTHEALCIAYKEFAERAKILMWCRDDCHLVGMHLSGKSYGFHDASNYRLSRLQHRNGMTFFDLNEHKAIAVKAIGRHNALNAAAVFALCLELGIDEGKVRAGLETFPGVQRRQTVVGVNSDVLIIDDYAHHPAEIRATLSALKCAYSDRRIVTLFQPHRYSRLRDHFEAFSLAFADSDVTFITDVYSAGEVPIKGIDGASLAKAANANYLNPEHVHAFLRPGDLLVTMGAGDITQWGEKLLKAEIQKLNVALLYGGPSVEHDISIVSAKAIADHLNPALYNVKQLYMSLESIWSHSSGETCDIIEELKKCDVAFPIFHGPSGEDGMIQGFLQTLSIPYVGCGYRSSSFCMDKIVTKQIASHAPVNIAPFTWAHRHEDREEVIERIHKKCIFPLWVKGAHLGSSIGIFKVEQASDLDAVLEKAFSFDDRVIIENHTPGREIEIAVLGNHDLFISEPGEVLTNGAFYDFDHKYGQEAMKSTTTPNLPSQVCEEAKKAARVIYQHLDCSGWARIDFLYTEDKILYFSEINPIPGCTPTSLYPRLCQEQGITYSDLLTRLIRLGLTRHATV
ncbi:MAG: UDP-N-acetylmuramate--L-alanine ligase [Chlamydiales bacterium]|nr:UDP-N-acetylmuramate--L-alanine ligase [Chlamydiales bacterium]